MICAGINNVTVVISHFFESEMGNSDPELELNPELTFFSLELERSWSRTLKFLTRVGSELT